jgi:hypothetical protein
MRRSSTFLFLIIGICALAYSGRKIEAENAGPHSATETNSNVSTVLCSETVGQFVSDLDALLEDSPRSLERYRALLAWYFTGNPTRVAGCNASQVIETAKRSKFLYEIGRPPKYQNYRIEFRGQLAKVYFSIDQHTGRIFGADAWWIQPYP